MSFSVECSRVGLKPKEVLSGPMRNAFKDAYATVFMEEVHRSFWDKAQGDADRFGISWKELEASTIAIKEAMLGQVPGEEDVYQKRVNGKKNGTIVFTITSVPQIQGIYSHRKLLSPDQLRTFKSHATGNHRTTANNRGLASVGHSPDVSKASLINVRSGRLAAALAPVTASRGRLYQNGPDATYSWGEYHWGSIPTPKLIINLTVPYADEVNYGNAEMNVPPRRLLPPGWRGEREIHNDAVKKGVEAAKRIHDQLKQKRL